jgi:hypothetical protein
MARTRVSPHVSCVLCDTLCCPATPECHGHENEKKERNNVTKGTIKKKGKKEEKTNKEN